MSVNMFLSLAPLAPIPIPLHRLMVSCILPAYCSQCMMTVNRDFRKQELADLDVVIERLVLEKAREKAKIEADIAAAAAEE